MANEVEHPAVARLRPRAPPGPWRSPHVFRADFATGLAYCQVNAVTQEEALQRAQEAMGYTFSDPSLLVSALTHASSTDSRVRSNERLEFLGDAILGMIVCCSLYDEYPQYLEGELTKVKSAVVSRKTCAQISHDLGLHRCLILGKGMTGRAPLPNSLAAAVYESLIAAIYIDCQDLGKVREFVLRTMLPHIREAAGSEHQRNYKSQLQQHAQKVLSSTPIYELLDEKGPDHSKCFEVGVAIGSYRYASAWGPSKKEAEQKAAYLALRELGVIEPSEEYEPEPEIA